MNTEINRQTPVVMLRSGHHGGLGIARSLGRLGVPVYSVDADRWEPAFSSRYCRGRFLLDVEDGPPDRAVDQLLEIGRIIGGQPVLIPTTDTVTIWAADHAEALRETFRFPHQDAALVRRLCDKSRMQELAARCGVAIAQSVTPRSREDVERFLESAALPLMIKANDERLREIAGGTKFIVHTRDELLAFYAKAEDRENPNLLIQEFIPGEDWMFDGYFDKDSECVIGATGKKIRRFPVNTGVSSLGVCLYNETVANTTARFMKAIGYRGILDIGYRRDSRDGQYKVLDANPRIGCTFRLFVAANGMDVARALYLDMTGQAIPPSRTDEGRKWIVEDFDLYSAVRLWRAGELTFRQWRESLRGVREAACFTFDDPLPFLLMGVTDCCEFFRWMRRQVGARKRKPPLTEFATQQSCVPPPG
jgi:predicted ATP-grasp superfamily ATP-dependent carboligase